MSLTKAVLALDAFLKERRIRLIDLMHDGHLRLPSDAPSKILPLAGKTHLEIVHAWQNQSPQSPSPSPSLPIPSPKAPNLERMVMYAPQTKIKRIREYSRTVYSQLIKKGGEGTRSFKMRKTDVTVTLPEARKLMGIRNHTDLIPLLIGVPPETYDVTVHVEGARRCTCVDDTEEAADSWHEDPMPFHHMIEHDPENVVMTDIHYEDLKITNAMRLLLPVMSIDSRQIHLYIVDKVQQFWLENDRGISLGTPPIGRVLEGGKKRR